MALLVIGIILMVVLAIIITTIIIKTDFNEYDSMFPVLFFSIYMFVGSVIMTCAGVDTYSEEQQLQGVKEYVNNPSKYKIIKDVVIEKKN